MRILVDAMCAEFGGIRTYVEHLLDAWPLEFPEDEVHVLVRHDSDLPTAPTIIRHPAAVRGPDAIGRPLAQSIQLPQLTRELAPDVVLATLPSTTVRRLHAPTAVVVYDLRHELRPEQFSRRARLLRAISYRRGYQIADGFISISQRSLDDLHELHPSTRKVPAVVAHLGADHVDGWHRPAEPGPAITFAHHSNKNLDLVLAGWQQVVRTLEGAPTLLVLGVGAARRAELAQRLAELGLDGHVEVAPFLPDDAFREAFGAARLILFPSDFEGFGLPVAEGMRLGIPVVIGPEPATQEVAAGHALVMDSWTPAALAEGVRQALTLSPERLEAARRYAEVYTWRATAHRTRELLGRLTRDGSARIQGAVNSQPSAG